MDGVPDQLGRYEVQERLAEGGFATVYRAYDAMLDRDVALKVLYPHFARTPAIRERFIHEGRALARVRHPNLVVVYEAGEDGDIIYLATELIDGYSLEALLATLGPLPPAEVLPVADQVAAALAALHGHQIIHRDVKPANIMLEERTGRVVLLDLGIARDLNAATQHSGWLVGTLPYMAPEQLRRSGRVSPRTDVYQLAATVYTLLAGHPPFSGDQVTVLEAVQHDPPPDLSLERAGLPQALVAAISMALAKEPGQRPPGPAAFAALLRRAVEGTTLPAQPVATVPVDPPAAELPAPVAPAPEPAALAATLELLLPRAPAPAPRRRGLLGAAAGLAVLAVLLVLAGGWALRRGEEGGSPAAQAQAKAATSAAGQGETPVITALALYDNRLTALDGEFEAGEQFRACLTGAVTPNASPLRIAVTARPEPPASATAAGVVAVSEPVTLTSARQCLPVNVTPPPLLPYRAYWAHALAPSGALISQSFRVRPYPEDILLSDSFEDPAAGGLPQDVLLDMSGARARYQDGVFSVRYPATRLNRSRMFALPVEERDTVLAVDARIVGETAGRHIALGCRSTARGGYRADIDPAAGTLRLLRHVVDETGSTGASETVLADWQPFEAIRRGEESNRLVLRCTGDRIELAVNGAEALSVQDGAFAAGGLSLGAGVRFERESPLEARFDNLVVARPARPRASGLPIATSFKAMNSVLYRQEREFPAPYRFTACITLGAAATQPLTFAATNQPEPPAAVDSAPVLARSEPVDAPRGETCRAVHVLAPPLTPARSYWVHAFIGPAYLATAHFRAAPEESDILAQMDFDSPADTAAFRLQHSRGQVESSVYRLTYTDPACNCVGTIELPGRAEGNAAIAVEARLHGGGGPSPLPLVLFCGTSTVPAYRLDVIPRLGTFELFRVTSSTLNLRTLTTLAVGATRALARDPAALNRVELSCSGGELRVTINGVHVAAVQDATYPEAGARFVVGLWGPEAGTEAIIERITIIRQ